MMRFDSISITFPEQQNDVLVISLDAPCRNIQCGGFTWRRVGPVVSTADSGSSIAGMFHDEGIIHLCNILEQDVCSHMLS
jgi:hypothetical protein